jgi:hypothetical protein
MGATGDVVMKIVGITAGAAGGALLTNALSKMLATMPKIVPPLATVAVGAMLPRFVKTGLGVYIGAGAIAAGGVLALSRSFLPLPGITGVGYVRPYGMTRSQKTVGAPPPGYSQKIIGTISDPAVIGTLGEN